MNITNEIDTFKRWKSITLKLDRELNHKDFLKDCIHFGINPKFLHVKNNFLLEKYRTEVIRFERFILKKYVRAKYSQASKLRRSRNKLQSILIEQCTAEKFIFYKEKLDKIRTYEKSKHREKQNKKLHFWLKNSDKLETMSKRPHEIPYLNLTDTKMNSHIDTILKKGPKFIFSEKIDIYDTIPKYESVIEKLPMEKRSEVRAKVQKELIVKMRKNKRDEEDRKEMKKLKNDKNIVVCKTDKTNKMVIMKRDNYNSMMNDTLCKMDLQRMDKDPLESLLQKTKVIIKDATWPTQLKLSIFNHAPVTPRMFGTLKDHKDPPRMRPIVNRSEGPTYALEKLMKSVYRDILPISQVSLNSNYDFVKNVSKIKLSNKDTMVSFDVIDLFPKINVTELEEAVNNEIASKYENKEIANTLISTNNLLMRNSFFNFNGTIYRQIKGVPMGSPISGIIAEYKMRNLENIFLERHPKITFWNRYVDDIFAIIENGEQELEDIFNDLNKADPDLKFTVEKEKDGCINFLDVKLMRNNNSLDLTVFRKPTNSNEIINYKCITPNNYKSASLISYIDRAIRYCSNDMLLHDELENIKNIAKAANFPRKFVERLIDQRNKRIDKIDSHQKAVKKFTSAIPYNNGAGIVLKREARKYGIDVPIRPNKNIFQTTRNERIPENFLKTAGIYKIPIKIENNSHKNFYIGVTKRRIAKRIEEHKRDLKFAKSTTALAQLNNEKQIDVEFDNVRKIGNYNNPQYALKREAVEIIREKMSINTMEHAAIDITWRKLIRRKTEHAQESDGASPEREKNITTTDDDPRQG